MNEQNILREITPLSEKDCFYVVERFRSEFTFPVHIHPEYELNFIEKAKGAQRIVGDSIEEIDDLELVLITSENLEHVWVNHNHKLTMIREITIQFHPSLFDGNLIHKNQFKSIKEMFEKARKGLLFTRKTIEKVEPMLSSLIFEKTGFYSVLKLMSILHELSKSEDSRILASSSFVGKEDSFDSRRVKTVHEYIEQHYRKKIRISDVAALVYMTEGTFSHFIKRRTGKSFTDYVLDVRLGYAIRLLVDSTHPVAEIADLCGFNNLSNFNRIFKKKKLLTPKDFRNQYKKTKMIL
jgi:AraC-like DNA-binding protein